MTLGFTTNVPLEQGEIAKLLPGELKPKQDEAFVVLYEQVDGTSAFEFMEDGVQNSSVAVGNGTTGTITCCVTKPCALVAVSR